MISIALMINCAVKWRCLLYRYIHDALLSKFGETGAWKDALDAFG